MARRSRLALALAGAALALSIAGVSYAHAANAEVMIDKFTFGPKELKVKAGTSVTSTHRDDIPHRVVPLPAFKSKVLDTGDTFSLTFTTPGTHNYLCSLHPHMTGVIVVEAATGSSAAP